MKKILAIVLLVLWPAFALADPFLKSDPEPSVTVFQLQIGGAVQSEILPAVGNIVKVDVQTWEGRKIIKARFGNPWPGVPGTYKWSNWSAPLDYAFPTKPSAPRELVVSP